MIIKNYSPFQGEHCETTAMGNLLNYAGVQLSEPMLFGIGQGLGFIYWDSKGMEFPFIGGRAKPDEISSKIATRLHLNMKVLETSSSTKAWQHIEDHLVRGIPVGLKLDSYYLDYFTNKVHFAAHYAVIYGFDDKLAYMADTRQQGGLMTTRLDSLAQARNAKGPMSSRNRSFTIEQAGDLPSLIPVIRSSIADNARGYLNPPIRNMGNKGIEKMSIEVVKWLSRSKDPRNDLCLTALLMERAGTGGSLFRNLYRDFLGEYADLSGYSTIEQAYLLFAEVAPMWSAVAQCIDSAGKTGNERELREASELLAEIAKRERTAMELLLAEE